jgi:peptidoglycan/LPS O-acetylase OafA/YrhL
VRESQEAHAVPPSRPATRSGGLDALRAIGALLVFGFHAQHATTNDLGLLGRGGSVGVLLFFALSGYLLYGPFLRGPVDLRRYAVRRFARIYPAYLFALVGVAALNGGAVLLAYPVTFLVFGQNYRPETITPAFLGASWTLVLEVTFYAALPLIALLVRGRELRVLTTLAILSVGVRLGAWIALADADDTTLSMVMASFPLMFAAFVPGMVAAVLEARGARTARWWVAGVGLLVLALAASTSEYGERAARGTFLVGGLTGIASILVLSAATKWVAPRPLEFFGDRLSYAFYLWHGEVFALAFAIAVLAGLAVDPWGIPIAFVIAVAISCVSAALIERPAMRIAAQRTHSRSLAAPAARHTLMPDMESVLIETEPPVR